MKDAKVALITGSSSGIGAATVKLFAQKGYRVVVCGTRQERVDQVAEECAKVSQVGPPLKLLLDFSKPENGQLAVSKTVEHFGRLDVLINNAGMLKYTPVGAKDTYEDYKEVMTVNVDATVSASLAACEHLKKTKGTLLFCSSVASTRAHANAFAYCMSKASMSMLAKCLAVDYAPEVRVNVVSPGPVRTDISRKSSEMTPEIMAQIGKSMTFRGEIGQPEEIASMFYYLASDEASFVSGQEIFVDGGYMLKQYSSVHNRMSTVLQS